MSNHTGDDRGEGGVAGAEAWLSDRAGSDLKLAAADASRMPRLRLQRTRSVNQISSNSSSQGRDAKASLH